MSWTKTKIVAAALPGLLLSGAATFLALRTPASRTPHSAASDDGSYKFAQHVSTRASDTRSLTKRKLSGLADFTSNIPVIVLSTKWPGPVSGSKGYSSFTMEVYEP